MRALFIDRDTAERRKAAKALLDEGHAVRTAEDARAGMVLLGAERADLVVLEASDPLASALLEAARGARIVVTAVPGDLEDAVALAQRGPHDLLRKPFDPALLALAARRAARDAATPSPREPAVVAIGRAMRRALRLAQSARGSRLPVLVLGEPGTGRTTFARLAASTEREPDVLSDGLAPELALANLDAWLDERAGRTLLIEEAQALEPALQRRLAAHLERAVPHGARILATATPALRELVREGRFSRALFLALGAITIELPPLHRRREDLPVLAEEALQRARLRLGRPELRFAKETLRKLAVTPLEGHVRELEAVVLRAAAACRGKAIVPADLALDELPRATEAPEGFSLPKEIWELPFAEAKARATGAFARAYLAKVLADAGGNASEAARRSGLDPANFRRARRRHERPR